MSSFDCDAVSQHSSHLPSHDSLPASSNVRLGPQIRLDEVQGQVVGDVQGALRVAVLREW